MTKLKNAVTSASMFVSENGEALRKHYKEVVKTSRGENYAPLFLSEVVEEVKKKVDVGQDLFTLEKIICPFLPASMFNKAVLMLIFDRPKVSQIIDSNNV